MRLIRGSELRKRLGFTSWETENRWRAAGRLPDPIKVGRANYYVLEEVEQRIKRYREQISA